MSKFSVFQWMDIFHFFLWGWQVFIYFLFKRMQCVTGKLLKQFLCYPFVIKGILHKWVTILNYVNAADHSFGEGNTAQLSIVIAWLQGTADGTTVFLALEQLIKHFWIFFRCMGYSLHRNRYLALGLTQVLEDRKLVKLIVKDI